jgi:hypothetical protein
MRRMLTPNWHLVKAIVQIRQIQIFDVAIRKNEIVAGGPRYGVTPPARNARWTRRLQPDSMIDSIIRWRYGILREQG